jgi:XTP/dITP diphosphohydrolase
MKHVYLLTGNADKIQAANLIFGAHDVEMRPLELDIPEIQASTSAEIARHAAQQAHELSGKPVIREDHSFYIKELNFPGPFMAYADKSIGVELLLKIINTLESREAYFELAAAYVDAQGVLHEFSYRVPVVMANEIRGNEKLRWERLMMLPGESKTFAETDSSTRAQLWTKNYEAIAQLIHDQK